MRNFFLLLITFVTGVIATHFYYILKYAEIYDKANRTAFLAFIMRTAFLEYLPLLILVILIVLTIVSTIVLTRLAFYFLKNSSINKDRDKIIASAEAEAEETIEASKEHGRYLADVAKEKEKELAKEKQRFFAEYERKANEKTIELKALREKVVRLKKNQYDPRRKGKQP